MPSSLVGAAGRERTQGWHQPGIPPARCARRILADPKDLLPTILEICEDFFAGTSQRHRHELDTLLRSRDITGGRG